MVIFDCAKPWQNPKKGEVYAIQKAFEEEKKLRLFNGEQRIQICLQLENFVSEIDWVKADYRSLDHFVQKAINEWKQFSQWYTTLLDKAAVL